MELQSLADRQNVIIDSRDIILNMFLFDIDIEEVQGILGIVIEHLVRPFVDTCVIDIFSNGHYVSIDNIRNTLLDSLASGRKRGGGHYSSFGYDLDVKSTVVSNKTGLRNLWKGINSSTRNDRYSDVSIDYSAYLATIMGNPSRNQIGTSELLTLLNEDRVFFGTPQHHDARLIMSCIQYSHISHKYSVHIQFSINMYVCQKCIQEVTDMLKSCLIKTSSLYERTNATISSYYRSNSYGCAHYDYFTSYDYADRIEGENRYTFKEWMTRDYLLGVEWCSVLSKHILDYHGIEASNFEKHDEGISCKNIGGSVMLITTKSIEEAKVVEIKKMRNVVRPLLLPGIQKNMSLQDFRRRWEIIVIEKDEITAHDGLFDIIFT